MLRANLLCVWAEYKTKGIGNLVWNQSALKMCAAPENWNPVLKYPHFSFRPLPAIDACHSMCVVAR
jgi:hypothetical protein